MLIEEQHRLKSEVDSHIANRTTSRSEGGTASAMGDAQAQAAGRRNAQMAAA